MSSKWGRIHFLERSSMVSGPGTKLVVTALLVHLFTELLLYIRHSIVFCGLWMVPRCPEGLSILCIMTADGWGSPAE